MIGVAAMAVAVLFVVILFLSLCFDKLEAQDNRAKNYYQVELATSFVGEETQIYVNDSLLYDAVGTDSVRLQFKPFEDQHLLMVVDKSTGNTRSFNLKEKACKVFVQKDEEGKVEVIQKEWEKE